VSGEKGYQLRHAVAAQVEVERKNEAKLKAAYHILVSSD
jgi:hypothetical protein